MIIYCSFCQHYNVTSKVTTCYSIAEKAAVKR